MNIEDFRQKIELLLPIKGDKENYIEVLNKSLDSYLELISSLDKSIIESYDHWKEKKQRIERLINAIKQIIKNYYEGIHSTSFSILQEQMMGNRGLKGIFKTINFCQVKKGTFLYRARNLENGKPKDFKDMLHIPFEKRGKIPTNRYNLLGYPCLYLGTTIHVCWEELKRPTFDNLMISGFKLTRDIQLFDLRLPSKDEYESPKLENLLLRLPLIIACSVIVFKPNDYFKPEYIIPQLLIEVIIFNIKQDIKNKDINEIVLGVIYTSTHINNELNYSNQFFENIAIPAINGFDQSGHCSVLIGCFETTNPICSEYKEIRGELSDSSNKLSSIGQKQVYNPLQINNLELKIKKLPLSQCPYLYISPTELNFDPNDPRPKHFNIYSNTEWHFSLEE